MNCLMADPCPECGADRIMVGYKHRCVPKPVEKAVRKRGRPKDGHKSKTLTATKPWVALGMSRATWYRKGAVDLETARTEWYKKQAEKNGGD